MHKKINNKSVIVYDIDLYISLAERLKKQGTIIEDVRHRLKLLQSAYGYIDIYNILANQTFKDSNYIFNIIANNLKNTSDILEECDTYIKNILRSF